MKRTLIKILRCPECCGGLAVTTFSGGKEIGDGVLKCGCGRWYPVIAGIPRMLPLRMINKGLIGGFMAKYSASLPKPAPDDAAAAEKVKEKTSRSFGFQWNVFSEMFAEYEKNFLNYIKPLDGRFFKGKLVLDAGCGFGRHTYYAAKYGAEVVGFDLSDAVGAARKNCSRLKKVHIVQGDIYRLPFRKKFNFIMSIGVLHHLPDPEAGFLSLAGLLRRGDGIFIWLYGKEGRWLKLHIVEGVIRKITTRMPHSMLYYACYLPAGVYHIFNIIYNILSSRRSTRKISRYVPFKGYAKFPFRVKHADAFDLLATPINNYYSRREVEKWAADAGLRDVEVTGMEGKSWRLFGRR